MSHEIEKWNVSIKDKRSIREVDRFIKWRGVRFKIVNFNAILFLRKYLQL